MNRAQGTAGSMPKIDQAAVEEFPLSLPSLIEQEEILKRVGGLLALADTIERSVTAATARADKLTQAILAKAFRGDLVPTEAKLPRQEGREYEPASVLLERVRKERAAADTGHTHNGTRRRASGRSKKSRSAEVPRSHR